MPKISVESFLYSHDLADETLWASSSSDEDNECKCNCANFNNKFYSDIQFQNIYRISKTTFQKFLEIINNAEDTLKGCCEKANMEQVLSIVLYFLGGQYTFKEISLKYNIPIYCVHSIIISVLDYFSSSKNLFISMPKDDRLPALSQLFKNKTKLEKIIAVLGVSYIQIQCPQRESENYLSIDGKYAVQIQSLVAADYQFLDCCINAGCLDCSEFLNRSLSLKQNTRSYKGYYVTGNDSYNNVPMIVTQKNYKLTKEQNDFHNNHHMACQIARKCFGCLKGRFKRLQKRMDYDLEFTSKVILTACIFHNLCLKFEDECNFYVEDDGYQGSSYKKQLFVYKM